VNCSILITFTSDDQERKHGFVLSYVERKYNASEEQTSMTTTYPATDVPTDTSTGITTTGVTKDKCKETWQSLSNLSILSVPDEGYS
jgi:hypothetical protein